jgi:CRP-like cAMP-binding protein
MHQTHHSLACFALHLADFIYLNSSPLVSLLGSYLDLDSLEPLEGIEIYFEAHTYRSGDVLFRRGEPADQVYFVHSGQVRRRNCLLPWLV